MSHKKVAGRDQQPIEELQQNDEAIWPGQCGQCGQPSQTSSNRRNSRKCDQWSPRRRVEKGTKAGRQLEETQNSGISSKGTFLDFLERAEMKTRFKSDQLRAF